MKSKIFNAIGYILIVLGILYVGNFIIQSILTETAKVNKECRDKFGDDYEFRTIRYTDICVNKEGEIRYLR